MFDTVDNAATYYRRGKSDRHEVIYKRFDENVDAATRADFEKADGFGEVAFCWNWELLVKAMPVEFSFLEVGVYKGRVLALIQRLADKMGKKVTLYGVSPLTALGDKYSKYPSVEYVDAIEANFATMKATLDNCAIIKGLSTDAVVQNCVSGRGPFDIIYIDGGHDYDTVCKDIDFYTGVLKKNGFLVLDDASLYLENPYGRFLGHDDVCRAIKDKLDSRTDFTHLFAVGHNRVWKQGKRVTFS
jgi:hypothetical protein